VNIVHAPQTFETLLANKASFDKVKTTFWSGTPLLILKKAYAVIFYI